MSEKKNIKIIARLTSYETVWATARSAPTRAYLLLDAHPEIRTGYTFILNIIYKKIIVNLIESIFSFIGKNEKVARTINSAQVGAALKWAPLDNLGITISLVNSLIASLNG